VTLPFTPEQFFAVFVEYNRAFWPIVAGLWLAASVMLVLAWRNPVGRSRAMSFFLSALWLWNAVAYHALLFTSINPAAWLFAGLFAAQSLLLFRAGLRGDVEYFASLRGLGLGLAGYALAYPFVSVATGHAYPAAPTFGVPCPTAILTIGLLLTARRGIPVVLAIIPVAWGFIGGSAAMLLSVPADYVLLVAGIAGVAVASARNRLQ
jgi:hypothetical protein